MTETGWPLIPREVLPAPVRPAKAKLGARLPASTGDPGRQLPIFGAETLEPSPADLAGLLAGPGRLGRMGGTARVTVAVDAAWRVHVLVAELVGRGLVVNWHPIIEVRGDAPTGAPDSSSSPEKPVKAGTSVSRPPVAATFDPDADPLPDLPSDVDFLPEAPSAAPGTVLSGAPDASGASEEPPEEDPNLAEPSPRPRFEVVTAYSRRLNTLASAWPAAADQLFLSGPRLRLWVAAAGEPVPGGYALGLDPAEESPDELAAIDAALVRAGLAGRVSDDHRQYVIAGRRRLRRLAELVGECPPAAPAHLWPGGAGA